MPFSTKPRLVLSIGVAAVLTAIPAVAYSLSGTSPLLDKFQQATSILLLPAILITILLSSGNIHDSNLVVVSMTCFAFYAACLYGLLTLITQRRTATNNY
jgi:hypothetical protein